MTTGGHAGRRKRIWVAPALAALGVLGVAGCGGSSGSATKSAPAAGHDAVRSYTAEQLKTALLPSVNGFKPSNPAQSGPLGGLPSVQLSKKLLAGSKTVPSSCDRSLPYDELAGVPAAAVSMPLRQGAVLSETLLSPSAALQQAALGTPPPAACHRYSVTARGITSVSSMTTGPKPSFGTAAYTTQTKVSSQSEIQLVAFASHGYVAKIQVSAIGTTISPAEALKIASTAYDRAEGVLK